MYRYLAALLLLPASCCVYPTLREWLKALSAGPLYFFSVVVRSGPQIVRRTSVWRNLLIYWPMKLGIELLRSRSFRVVAGKIRQHLRHRACKTATETHDRPREAPAPLSADDIMRLVQDPEIAVISFDIFDTLLERPVLRPKDIFYLVAAAVDTSLGVDFVKMRWTAEEETGLPNARLADIYAHMQKKYGLSDDVLSALMAEELRCEKTLLAPRADIKRCYEEAVRAGKRVIAISDMYIPGDILHSILQSKGYEHIAAVYVSCDNGQRKSDGTLYETVLTAEHCKAENLLHVGDNLSSDCLKALACGIPAVYCPPLFRRCLEATPELAALLEVSLEKEPLWSPLLAFALQRLCDHPRIALRVDALQDVGDFAVLTLAPLLTGFCLSLAGDEDLRREYRHIYFASRDGYLPHKVYENIARHIPDALPGIYFQAGRRAYYPFLFDDFYSYAAKLPPAEEKDYSFHDMIRVHFSGSGLLSLLEAEFSKEELALPFFGDTGRCLALLRRFDEQIDAFMQEKRLHARMYYNTIFDSEEHRYIVFDVGYSGSVGEALSAVTGKIVDKLYFLGSRANDVRDARLGSKTRIFMQSPDGTPYNLLFEELFSPCCGGTVDFTSHGQPVLEELNIDTAFQNDMESIHSTCMDFADTFCRRLGSYAVFVRPTHGDTAMHICRWLLAESPFCNGHLLKNITFPDPLHHSNIPSLEKKMERFFSRPTPFTGTGFENPRRRLMRSAPAFTDVPRIGLHAHIYNPALLDEMLRYFRAFPVPADIFITVTEGKIAGAVRRLFGPRGIPGVRRCEVLVVPNRGRDVAPWVLGMRPYQKDYDLFCHVHAKESAHFPFGGEWRRYLLDNLLQPAAVAAILDAFRANARLGCLFPSPFPPLERLMRQHKIPPEGFSTEAADACSLLRRMGLRDELCRSELFFSMGTMLWYRPEALRQLFTFELKPEEFAAEPIGVEGTLAHAIERLPAVIAERNGYVVQSLTVC